MAKKTDKTYPLYINGETLQLENDDKPIVPEIHLHQWTYDEFNQYVKATADGDFERAGELMEEVINDWSMFDVDPNAEHPFNELNFVDEAIPLVFAVRDAITSFRENADVSMVIVDLSKWKWQDFNTFKTVSADDPKKATELMKDVCKIKGVNNDKNLSAVEGILMMSALSEAIQKVFSGKN